MRASIIIIGLAFVAAAPAIAAPAVPDNGRCEAKPFTLKKAPPPVAKPAEVKMATAAPVKAPAPKPKPRIEIGCKQPK